MRMLRLIAAAALVAGILLFAAEVLGNFWAGTIPVRTIRTWCSSLGIPPSLTSYVAIAQLRIPSWGVLAIFATYVGLKRPRTWLRDVLLVSLLFVYGSVTLPMLLWPTVIRAPTSIGWLLELISIPIAVGVAFISQRFANDRQRYEDQHPHCESCGYDIIGINEKCPECGTPISEAQEQATARVSHPVPNAGKGD